MKVFIVDDKIGNIDERKNSLHGSPVKRVSKRATPLAWRLFPMRNSKIDELEASMSKLTEHMPTLT